MVAEVDGKWLGEVRQVDCARGETGWVTIRVPLANCTVVEQPQGEE